MRTRQSNQDTQDIGKDSDAVLVFVSNPYVFLQGEKLNWSSSNSTECCVFVDLHLEGL